MEELLGDNVTSLNTIHLGAAATRISQLYSQQQQQQQQVQIVSRKASSHGLAAAAPRPDIDDEQHGSGLHRKLPPGSTPPQQALSAHVGDHRQLQRLMTHLEWLYQHALPQLEARYAGMLQPGCVGCL